MRFMRNNSLPAALVVAVLFGSFMLPASATAQGGSSIAGDKSFSN